MRVMTTTVFIFIGAILSFGLFWLKVQVQDLEAELIATERAVVAERQAIRVLNAEWALLNDPARLQGLARKHLELMPTDAHQIARIGDVDQMRGDIQGVRHEQ